MNVSSDKMKFEVFFQLIGLCPTSLNIKNYRENVTLILSVLSLSQAVAVLALTVTTLNFKNGNFPKTSSANAWTVSLEQLSAAASHLGIIIESLKCRHLFLEFRYQVDKAWEVLGMKNRLKDSRQQWMFWVGVVIVGVGLRLKVLLSFTHNPELYKYTFYIFPSNILSFFRIVQIAYYLTRIQAVLKTVEEEMKTVTELSEYTRSVVNEIVVRVAAMAPKVMKLRLSYHHLERANTAINTLVGHGLLMNILRIFVEAICSCFWVYSSIYNNNFEEVDGKLSDLLLLQ